MRATVFKAWPVPPQNVDIQVPILNPCRPASPLGSWCCLLKLALVDTLTTATKPHRECPKSFTSPCFCELESWGTSTAMEGHGFSGSWSPPRQGRVPPPRWACEPVSRQRFPPPAHRVPELSVAPPASEPLLCVPLLGASRSGTLCRVFLLT